MQPLTNSLLWGGCVALLICIGTLAAFGLLSALWLIYGLCCGKASGSLVIICGRGHGLLRRCLWLREMGLLRCRMAVVAPDLDAVDVLWLRQHGIEIWKPAGLPVGYDIGDKRYGAGTGNSPGCHQCGGVSEL